MPHRLDEHEHGVEHQRHDSDEHQLRHRQRWAGRGAREIRDDQRERCQRRQHCERGDGAFHPERDHVVPHAANDQAQPDDTVAHDHHGGKHGVACQRNGLRPTGEHHRDDQGTLDHRYREREDERPERLADTVRDHLGVMHGHEYRRDQRDSGRHDQQARSRTAPRQREHRAGRERHDHAQQGRLARFLPGHVISLVAARISGAGKYAWLEACRKGVGAAAAPLPCAPAGQGTV